MSEFYVYVDWTCELKPRPFYVGFGNQRRVAFFERNEIHKQISTTFGVLREVVLMTSVRNIAASLEVELITFYKTHFGEINHWGANLTSGGEGGFVLSYASRAKMSQARIGQKHTLGMKHTLVTRLKMSFSQRKIRKHRKLLYEMTDEIKNKISCSLSGERHPNFGIHLTEKTRLKIGFKKRKLSDTQVSEIKNLYRAGVKPKVIAAQFDVSTTWVHQLGKNIYDHLTKEK